jgi:hypothetical protein
MDLPVALSVFNPFWRIYEFCFDKIRRVKVIYGYYPNFLLGEGFVTAMYDFTIVNAGGRKLFIKNVCYELSKFKGTYFSPGIQHLKFPIALEYGEEVHYQIDYADLEKYLKKGRINKIRIVVTDSFTKEYKSQWMQIEQWDVPELFTMAGFKKARSNHYFRQKR